VVQRSCGPRRLSARFWIPCLAEGDAGARDRCIMGRHAPPAGAPPTLPCWPMKRFPQKLGTSRRTHAVTTAQTSSDLPRTDREEFWPPRRAASRALEVVVGARSAVTRASPGSFASGILVAYLGALWVEVVIVSRFCLHTPPGSNSPMSCTRGR
jgi:hypothetical protein